MKYCYFTNKIRAAGIVKNTKEEIQKEYKKKTPKYLYRENSIIIYKKDIEEEINKYLKKCVFAGDGETTTASKNPTGCILLKVGLL